MTKEWVDNLYKNYPNLIKISHEDVWFIGSALIKESQQIIYELYLRDEKIEELKNEIKTLRKKVVL